MPETLKPGEELEKTYTVSEALIFFSEEERAIIERHLKIRDQIMADFRKTESIMESLASFCDGLLVAKGVNVVAKCKLYHLYGGSSQTEAQWRSMPIDTADNDFTNFVDTKIVPDLENLGLWNGEAGS